MFNYRSLHSRACGIAVALCATFAARAASAQISSSATVSSTSLPAGSALTVDARVTNSGASVAGGHIQIFLRNKANNAGQAAQNCDTTIAGSGASTSCRQVFSALPVGTYGVEIGVFDASWTTNFHWNASSSLPTVTVGAVTANITVAVDTSRNRRAISPLVYGANGSSAADVPPGTTILRGGGNRWTAYNWASNYSNAGTDFGPYNNDTFMGSPSSGPGVQAVTLINNAKAAGMAGLVTVPIQGWVSKDPSGPVSITGPLTDHFIPNQPRKGSAFTTTPSPNSTTVFQDEFANFIAQLWGAGRVPHISLDNEPDLWADTHGEVQRSRLTYANIFAQSVASAAAIRAAVPGALIYGPVSYGWAGYMSLQSAPDAPSNASIDNSFLDAYLQRMNAESTSRRVRLLDALDIHYYTEAQGCGTRVTFGSNNSDCIVAARVQAPRSLAEPNFVETSWITQTTQGSSFGRAIQLIPRMMAKIAAGFPGTRLAITEYDFGGTDHISGALAQADALGLMGREGVFAATWWRLAAGPWTPAAWRAYRNYDGAGRNFGDTAVLASSTDLEHVSAFASVDAATTSRVVLVLVHRPTLAGSTLDLRSRTLTIQLTHAQTLRTARAWQLTPSASPTSPWPRITVSAPSNNALTVTLPGASITTIELTP